MAYNPYFDPHEAAVGPAKIRFSRVEVRHLAIAVAALTIAMSFVRAPSPVADIGGRAMDIVQNPLIPIASFLAVSSAFVLHELGHKIVAQRYGHWAEFRGQIGGLGMSLLVAIMAKLLFAAPGAVMIMGNVTRRENGLISLVGPAINFVIAAATLPVAAQYVDPDEAVPMIFGTVAVVNAILATFNLLPFGPLDGKKVLGWNKLVWTGSFVASVALMIVTIGQIL